MKWNYQVSTDAIDDLAEIDDYVLTYADADFADTLAEHFVSTFETICKYPHRFPVHHFDESLRLLHEYLSVNVYHYKVFFWLDEDRRLVNIYRMLHERADFSRRTF